MPMDRELRPHATHALEEGGRDHQGGSTSPIDQQLGERREGVGPVLPTKSVPVRTGGPVRKRGDDEGGGGHHRGDTEDADQP